VGVAAPWPVHVQDPPSVSVTPTPADTVLACAGPLLALGRDASQAGGLTAAQPSAVVSGSDGAALETSALSASPAVTGGDGAPALVAPPVDGRRTDAVAASSATIEAEDLRGYSASACRQPLIESWLVGGSTTTGSADLVLLANPSDVAATVQLTLHGATGFTAPPAGADLRVDARSQRIVPLAALGVGEEAPIVRVTASGAPVAAALQSNITRTLLPGGVDQAGAVVSAETTQVVPGVQVLPSAVDAAPNGATTVVRAVSPGVATTVTVTAVDEDGEEVLRQEAPLEADLPAEIELAGLAAGRYVVTVSADAPVVAGVWQTTGLGEGSDFVWYTPAPLLSGPTLVAVPAGPTSVLFLAGTGADADVALEPVSGPGAALEASVDADGVTVVTVASGTVYRLESGEPVRASVSYSGPGALGGFPVWPADAAAPALTVHP
ncbi:MAG: large extracellular alpha-helical protein, partial [Microbacterium sp.]|nr:large extracellular alpha-helical protein [Microbacterium sp.]